MNSLMMNPIQPCRRMAAMLLLGLALPMLAGDEQLPQVRDVESQPLLAQVSRLQEAMEFIGQPLPQRVRDQLAAATRQRSASAVAEAVQNALDPLCLGTVTVQRDGALKFQPAGANPKLIEQGWRAVLVKVVNLPGSKDSLRADTPGARPLPESTAAEVPLRWIDLEMYDRRPMNPTLSGLALEYRIVQFWAREPGLCGAPLAFKLSGSGTNPARLDEVSRKLWNFDADSEGWRAENQCALASSNGVLRIEITGGDPFLMADVRMPPGDKIVRIRARTGTEAVWQLFWMTEPRRAPDPGHVATFQVTRSAGEWAEFKFNFKA